jgi:hypothetical protein
MAADSEFSTMSTFFSLEMIFFSIFPISIKIITLLKQKRLLLLYSRVARSFASSRLPQPMKFFIA